MAVSAEFSLLGPLTVRIDGALVPIPAAKHRAVLAVLLLHANRVVTVDDLAEALWGENLPSAARTGVQNYVMRLRKALGPGGARITTQPRGYRLRVEPGELDLDRFEGMLRDAATAVRDSRWPEAADGAVAALAMWQGEPLADVGSDLLTSKDAPRLAELRLQALETRIDADLHLDRHGEVIGELRQLAAQNPLRERVHALLMLALYRDGRQAEALAAYQHAGEILVHELGAEPGSELQHLRQQILTADPALNPPTAGATGPLPATPLPAAPLPPVPAPATPLPAAPVPRELPGDVAAFTGRAAELAELDRLLLGSPAASVGPKPAAAVISALSGTAGVGKTALAVHWAHHAAAQFPDGQLYVNLRGYDPDQPTSATDALAAFLRSLGVPGQDIPPEESERASRYRSLLAGKRVLVLLDNAATVAQVRPMLPGHPGCAVLVTSRDSLAGLVARDGAHRLDLDLLPVADAVALLRELTGARVDIEPDAAVTLARQCARLPLALRIAAELAAARPDVPLASLVSELGDQQHRLDLLDAGGDPRTSVRSVFSWSYLSLDDGTARLFRLVSLHPGADFDACAATALTGSTLPPTRQALDALARAHLLQPTSPGRYAMHDLLRAYAREQATACDPDDPCQQALTRLFDYYLAAAAAAMDVLYPAEAQVRPRVPPSAAAVPVMPGEADAHAWLDGERANLVAMAVHCTGNGWPEHAIRLADMLFRYLMNGSHLPEAHTIYSHELHAARRSGDLVAQADALNGLGTIGVMRGRFGDAADNYRAALERYRLSGHHAGQARALGNLGIAEAELHNHWSAASYFRQAIAAYEDAGNSLGAARALSRLASSEVKLGSYDQAEEHLQRALSVLREANFESGEADALTSIGDLNFRRGHLTQAAGFFGQALTIYRRLGNHACVANELYNLGEVSSREGDYPSARSYLQQALELHRQAGYQYGEILTLRSMAEVLHATGQPAAARDELAAALRLAAETGNTYQQATVHRDLAESHHSAGEHDRARHHWQQAQALYREVGAPEADEVSTRLAALDSGDRIKA